MQTTSITKEALASALIALLRNQPLSKISIKDITDYCNISRNTFYYHFRDKYELINWIFYNTISENVLNFSDPLNLSRTFVTMCKCLHANRKFYLACLQYTGQNSLYDYIYDFYYKLWKAYLTANTRSFRRSFSEDELNILARMKTHSMIGIFKDWVTDGMHDNYMIYFEQMCSVLNKENTHLL